MRRAIGVAGLVMLACGGMTREQAGREVDQLMVLYKENRPKFVVQKQEIEQAGSCDRAQMLRAAIDEKARAAAMSPADTETITLVQMELTQAEKNCLAR
jgi:hypothetical protein